MDNFDLVYDQAFSDGYEQAQLEFADAESKDDGWWAKTKAHVGRNSRAYIDGAAALGTGAIAAAIAAKRAKKHGKNAKKAALKAGLIGALAGAGAAELSHVGHNIYKNTRKDSGKKWHEGIFKGRTW